MTGAIIDFSGGGLSRYHPQLTTRMDTQPFLQLNRGTVWHAKANDGNKRRSNAH